MADESIASSLLGGIEFDDPRLYSLLEILIRDFYTLNRQINPPTTQSFLASGLQIGSIGTLTEFNATIFGNNVRLTWGVISGTSYYDIRYKAGVAIAADWNTSNNLLRTSSLSADINPITIPLTIGSHSFLIKAVDGVGLESTTPLITTITINQAAAPSISATVIDNNVLLSWTTPISQFDIAHYNIYKDGTLSGIMKGTFEVIFETSGGIYEYGIESVDIVGNIGIRNTLQANVNQPPDYELQDERSSSFNGTRVNCIVTSSTLLCNVKTC